MAKTAPYIIPFKTPVDYFDEILGGDYNAINKFKQLLDKKPDWLEKYDNDLHIYPYTAAVPGLLSVGCPNKCSFCPTAARHMGRIHFANAEHVIPQYAGQNVHFMDENFFANDMSIVLPLLQKHNVTWCAMSDYRRTVETFEQYGEDKLAASGCRLVEVGLENVALCNKVKNLPDLPNRRIRIYYLNMTCLPGETKETIQENARWMKQGEHSLAHPIHHNNGLWYACGQFYFPYDQNPSDGYWISTKECVRYARVHPTWIPNTLLDQTFTICNLEQANYYGQLVYGIKQYRPPLHGSIREFIGDSAQRTVWLLTGIRCGAII